MIGISSAPRRVGNGFGLEMARRLRIVQPQMSIIRFAVRSQATSFPFEISSRHSAPGRRLSPKRFIARYSRPRLQSICHATAIDAKNHVGASCAIDVETFGQFDAAPEGSVRKAAESFRCGWIW
jgi:hypothetical protein